MELFIEKECKHHGVTKYRLFTRSRTRKDGTKAQGYRCVRCNAENKANHRKRIRKILVAEHGGKCLDCGYNRCEAALHFHHRDPSEKEFELSKLSTNLDRARKEAAKCDLICGNCHIERHVGYLSSG